MKLTITSILTVLLVLAGCVVMGDYTEPENRVIVTALAVDIKDGQLEFAMEASLPDEEGKSETTVISVTAENPDEALKKLESASYGKLLLSQCPVIIIGSGIPSQRLKEIFYFFFENNDASLSVRFVYCKKASSLLKDNENSKPAGYDIEKLINNNERINKSYKTESFAEIIDKSQRGKSEFSIPKVEKDEERFVLSGICRFEDFSVKDQR